MTAQTLLPHTTTITPVSYGVYLPTMRATGLAKPSTVLWWYVEQVMGLDHQKAETSWIR